MTDTQPNNPSARVRDTETAVDEQQFTADEAIDAVARIDAATEQLVDDAIGSDSADESLNDLLAEVESLDESMSSDSAVIEDLEFNSSVDVSDSIDETVQENITQAVNTPVEPVSKVIEGIDDSSIEQIIDESQTILNTSSSLETSDPIDAVPDADDDSEALFDSDFDPVEAVLDDVFETKAVLVQQGESTSVIVREEISPPEVEAASDDRAGHQNDDGAETAVGETGIDIADRSDVRDDVDVDKRPDLGDAEAYAAPSDDSTVPEPVDSIEDAVSAEPVDVGSVNVPLDSAAVDQELVEAEQSLQQEPQDKPVVAAVEQTLETPASPVAVTEVTADTSPVESKAKKPRVDVVALLIEQINRMAENCSPMLRAVLLVFNRPLRYVPTSLRPLIDYLALTLIMWVPIVWAIVWLVKQ